MQNKKQSEIIISIKVTPKAHRNEFIGYKNGEVCIRLAAVPEKGEANAELIAFLAKTLKLSKSQITLISGEKSRHKKVSITGITTADLSIFGML